MKNKTIFLIFFLFLLLNKSIFSGDRVFNQFIPNKCKPIYRDTLGGGSINVRCPAEDVTESEFERKIKNGGSDYVDTFITLSDYKLTQKGLMTEAEQFATLNLLFWAGFIRKNDIRYLNSKTGTDGITGTYTGTMWVQDLEEIENSNYSINVCRNVFDFIVKEQCINVTTERAKNTNLFATRQKAQKGLTIISLAALAVSPQVAATLLIMNAYGLPILEGIKDIMDIEKSSAADFTFSYAVPFTDIGRYSGESGDIHKNGYVYQLFNNDCPYNTSEAKKISKSITGYSNDCRKTSYTVEGLTKYNNCRLLTDDMVAALEAQKILEKDCLCDDGICNEDYTLTEEELKTLTEAKNNKKITCYKEYQPIRSIRDKCVSGVVNKNEYMDKVLNDPSVSESLKEYFRSHYGVGSYICGFSGGIMIGCLKKKTNPPPPAAPRIAQKTKSSDPYFAGMLFTSIPYVRPFSMIEQSANSCPIRDIGQEVGELYRGTFLGPKMIVKYGDNETLIQYDSTLFNYNPIVNDNGNIFSPWSKDIIEKKSINNKTCSFYEDDANFTGEKIQATICSRLEYDESAGNSRYVAYAMIQADPEKRCDELYEESENNIDNNETSVDKIMIKIGSVDRPPLKYKYNGSLPLLPVSVKYIEEMTSEVELVSEDNVKASVPVQISVSPSLIYSDNSEEKSKIMKVRSKKENLNIPFLVVNGKMSTPVACANIFLHKFCVEADPCSGISSISVDKRKNPDLCSGTSSEECGILNIIKNQCNIRYNCSYSNESKTECEESMHIDNAIKLNENKDINYFKKIKQFQSQACLTQGLEIPTESIIKTYGDYGDKTKDYIISYKNSSSTSYEDTYGMYIGFKDTESSFQNDHKNMLQVNYDFIKDYPDKLNYDALSDYLNTKYIKKENGDLIPVSEYYLKPFCFNGNHLLPECVESQVELRQRDSSEFGLCVSIDNMNSRFKISNVGSYSAYVPLRCNYHQVSIASGGGGGTAIKGHGASYNKDWRDMYDQPGSSGTYASFIINHKVHDIDMLRLTTGEGDKATSIGDESRFDEFSELNTNKSYYQEKMQFRFGFPPKFGIKKRDHIKNLGFQTSVSSLNNNLRENKSKSGVVGLNHYANLRFNYAELEGGISNGTYMAERKKRITEDFMTTSVPSVRFIDDIRTSGVSYFQNLIKRRSVDIFGINADIDYSELGEKALIYKPIPDFSNLIDNSVRQEWPGRSFYEDVLSFYDKDILAESISSFDIMSNDLSIYSDYVNNRKSVNSSIDIKNISGYNLNYFNNAFDRAKKYDINKKLINLNQSKYLDAKIDNKVTNSSLMIEDLLSNISHWSRSVTDCMLLLRSGGTCAGNYYSLFPNNYSNSGGKNWSNHQNPYSGFDGNNIGCKYCIDDDFSVNEKGKCFLKSRYYSAGGCISSSLNEGEGTGFGGDGVAELFTLKVKPSIEYEGLEMTSMGHKIIDEDGISENECKPIRCPPQNLKVFSQNVPYICEYIGEPENDYEFNIDDIAIPKRCYILNGEGANSLYAIFENQDGLQACSTLCNNDFKNVYSNNFSINVEDKRVEFKNSCENKICVANLGHLFTEDDIKHCSALDVSLFQSMVTECVNAKITNDAVMNSPFKYDRYYGICTNDINDSITKTGMNKFLSNKSNTLFAVDKKINPAYGKCNSSYNIFKYNNLRLDRGGFVKKCSSNVDSSFYQNKPEYKEFSASGLESFEFLGKTYTTYSALLKAPEEEGTIRSFEPICPPIMPYNSSLSLKMKSIVEFNESVNIRNSVPLSSQFQSLSEIDLSKTDFYDFRYSGNASWQSGTPNNSLHEGLCLTNYISYDDSGKLIRECVDFYGKWNTFGVYSGAKKSRPLPCLLTCDMSEYSIDDTIEYDYNSLKGKRIITHKIENGYSQHNNYNVNAKQTCPILKIKDYKGEVNEVQTVFKANSNVDYGKITCNMPAIESPYYYGGIDNYYSLKSPKTIVERVSNESCLIPRYFGEYESETSYYYEPSNTPSSVSRAACSIDQLDAIISNDLVPLSDKFIYIDDNKYFPKPKMVDENMRLADLKEDNLYVINFFTNKIRINCESIDDIDSKALCKNPHYEIFVSGRNGNSWISFYNNENDVFFSAEDIRDQFLEISNSNLSNKVQNGMINLLTNYNQSNETLTSVEIFISTNPDRFTSLIMKIPKDNSARITSDANLIEYDQYRAICMN